MLTKRVLLPLTAMLLSSAALAGFEVGNGGGSLVCRDPADPLTILEARFFDFAEGNYKYDYVIAQPEGTADDMLKRISDQIGALYPDVKTAFDTELAAVKQIAKTKPVQLERIDDAKYVYLPESCLTVKQQPVYEQVANYLDTDNQLIISQSIFAKLSEQDRAGLYSHEAIYRIYRKMGAKDSIKARQLNALAFSVRTEVNQKVFRDLLDHIDDVLFRTPTEEKLHDLDRRLRDAYGKIPTSFTEAERTVNLNYFTRVLEFTPDMLFYDLRRDRFGSLDSNQIVADYFETPNNSYFVRQITRFAVGTVAVVSYINPQPNEDFQTYTPLMSSIIDTKWWYLRPDGEARIAILFDKWNADVNVKQPETLYTALHYAAGFGSLDAINLLLGRKDIDVNAKTAKGFTPLMTAILLNRLEAVKVLLKDQRVSVDVSEITALLKQTVVREVNGKEFSISVVPEPKKVKRLLKKLRKIEID